MSHRHVAAVLLSLALLPGPRASAQSRTFTLDADFDAGSLANVVHSPSDQLVLAPPLATTTNAVWATNYLYGYVVRLDATTGRQVARYDSALVTMGGTPTGARPAQEYCNFATTGNCPGRTAIDEDGDAFILNRAFGHQGTVAKIAADVSRCIDRNSDGIIQTSRDVNNDGLIDVNPAAGEYFGQADECILTTFPVGPNNVYPRAIGVDRYGKLWVGTHNDAKLYRFASDAPYTLETSLTVGGNPYSLATGGDYVIVSSSSGTLVRRVNVTTLAVSSLACPSNNGTYGIAVEPSGGRAWLGRYFTGQGIYRADFDTNTCTFINGPAVTTAMTIDLAGNVWAAGYSTNTVYKYNSAGVLLGSYPAGGGNPHGLSVDYQGNIWTVLHSPPSLSKINPNTGAIIGTHTITGPGVPNADPYLYGDYTGTQMTKQVTHARTGRWTATHDGLAAGTPWTSVSWNAEPEGDEPALTSISVSVRAADTLAALAGATYVAATNGGALAGVIGRYVEVRADLAGPGWVTPVLSDLTLEGCLDADLDGSCVPADCNDADPSAFPGATETCDDRDNDCNGIIDDSPVDADADGSRECDDCNDADPTVRPGAPEVHCDGVDNDCNSATVDDDPPSAACHDLAVQLDAAGSASITAAQVDAGSTDDCGIVARVVSPNTFGCANVGTPVTVTLTVTDAAGQADACTAVVTVQDTVPPVARCRNVTLALGASGTATLVAADVDNGSTDACGIAALSVAPSSFTCANLGPNLVTLTVRDVNGNVATCTATVTVRDVTAPLVACAPAVSIECGSSVDPSVTGTPSATDACDARPVLTFADAMTPGCGGTGVITRTWTATDASGNAGSCAQLITLVDTTPPTVAANAADARCLWSPNHAWACWPASSFSPIVSDLCGPASWELLRCESSQPADAGASGDPNGDGHTDVDCVIDAATREICVRSERAGQGTDRVYTVWVRATDACGLATDAPIAAITVPHDGGGRAGCEKATIKSLAGR